MKPFKVNRNSWHYKLNRKFFNTRGDNDYYMHDSWEPRHNNFCAYWRATMFRLLFATLLIIGAGAFLFMLGDGIYHHPLDFLITVSLIVGTFATFVLIIVLSELLKSAIAKRGDQPAASESLFVQRYRAYKSKVCPGVEYD
jgi:VIT1/CCC1 family predicted Fe2+/Mn2+ transporter